MQAQSQFHLLKTRRFLPFYITQFLGALNDNIFKNALLIIIAYQASIWTSVKPALLTNICAGLFILPFFLFSAMAGQLADKYEKSKLIRIVKIVEILIMILATIGLVLHQLYFLLFVLFMLGTQATYFGPVKYSLLPQVLSDDELLGGNGLVQMGTFVAILVGTIIGGVLASFQQHMVIAVSSAILFVALAGFTSSCFIPKASPNDATLKINWEPISQIYKNVVFATDNKTVFFAIIANAWFWFFGAVVLTQIPVYVESYLGGQDHVTTLLLTVFSIGIGLGSLLCDKLSGHQVEMGLVPLGALGISIFSIALYFSHPYAYHGELMSMMAFLHLVSSWCVLLSSVTLGIFAGIYVVPLFALIQQRSMPAHRSRIIAANNIIGAFFMVIAALYAIALLHFNFTIPQIFLSLALVNVIVVGVIFCFIPEFIRAFWKWIFKS